MGPRVAVDDGVVRLDRQADIPAGHEVIRVVLVTDTVMVVASVFGDVVIGTDVVGNGTTDGAWVGSPENDAT